MVYLIILQLIIFDSETVGAGEDIKDKRIEILENQVKGLQQELAEIKSLLQTLKREKDHAETINRFPMEEQRTVEEPSVIVEKQAEPLQEEFYEKEQAPFSAPLLKLRGFANVAFSLNDTDRKAFKDETNDRFLLGELDLFITSELSERVSVLNETVFEPRNDGQYVVDIERVIVKYDFRDSLNIQAGRFYTSLGYWNEIYHHGEWLQTSLGRPDILNFEDENGFLPIHMVGLVFKGNYHNPSLSIDYTLEVGNGRGTDPEDVQLKMDANDSKAVNLALALEPSAFDGLRLGGNIYSDQIPQLIDAPTGLPIHGKLDERILSANLIYTSKPWEILAEYYSIRHLGSEDPDTHNQGYYMQVSYEIEDWTPYFRYDAIQIDNDNRFFLNTDDRDTFAIGARWDFTTWNALTLQFSHSSSSKDNVNKLKLQSSFMF